MMDVHFSQPLIIVCPQKFFSRFQVCVPDIYLWIFSMFDNGWTVPYSCLVSVWAIIFLELWKRLQARSYKVIWGHFKKISYWTAESIDWHSNGTVLSSIHQMITSVQHILKNQMVHSNIVHVNLDMKFIFRHMKDEKDSDFHALQFYSFYRWL